MKESEVISMEDLKKVAQELRKVASRRYLTTIVR